MNSARKLSSAVILVFTIGLLGPALHARQSASHDALRALEDDYWAFFQRENPEVATILGQYRYNDRLTDFSLAHVAVQEAEADAFLKRASAIDPVALSDSEKLDLLVIIRTLQDQIEGIRLKTYEMPVDQFNGAQLLFPQLVSAVPLDTVKHYEDYIARLNQIPGRFDQIIECCGRARETV